MPFLYSLMPGRRGGLPLGPGIYKISFRTENGQGIIPINRAGGIDEDGIIYVGSTRRLYERVGNFRVVVFDDHPQMQAHAAANRYVRIEAMNRIFPPNQLWFEWEEHDDPMEEETRVLLNYLQEFGELPPFNNKFPYADMAPEWGEPENFPLPEQLRNEREDHAMPSWVREGCNECPDGGHVLTYAETGFAQLSIHGERCGIDRETLKEFARAVNERGEPGSLHPLAPISAIPRSLIRDNAEREEIQRKIAEFFAANREKIRASRICIFLQGHENPETVRAAIAGAVTEEERNDDTPVEEVCFEV